MTRPPIVDLEEIRFRHRAALLHRRGERLTVELLEHVARERLLGTYLDRLIERYLAIPDAALDLVSGRDTPPLPLHLVPR